MANPFEFNGQLPTYDQAYGRFDGNDNAWPAPEVNPFAEQQRDEIAQNDPRMSEALARRFNPYRSHETSPQIEAFARLPLEAGPIKWLRDAARAGKETWQEGYAGTQPAPWYEHTDTPPASNDPASDPMVSRAQSILGVAIPGSMPLAPYGALGVFGGKVKLPPKIEALVTSDVSVDKRVIASSKIALSPQATPAQIADYMHIRDVATIDSLNKRGYSGAAEQGQQLLDERQVRKIEAKDIPDADVEKISNIKLIWMLRPENNPWLAAEIKAAKAIKNSTGEKWTTRDEDRLYDRHEYFLRKELGFPTKGALPELNSKELTNELNSIKPDKGREFSSEMGELYSKRPPQEISFDKSIQQTRGKYKNPEVQQFMDMKKAEAEDAGKQYTDRMRNNDLHNAYKKFRPGRISHDVLKQRFWMDPAEADGGRINFADGGGVTSPFDLGAIPIRDAQSPFDLGAKQIEEPNEGWRGYPTVIGSGLAQGAITGVGKAIRGIPELYSDKPEETTLGRAGKALERYGLEKFPLKPEEQKSISGQVATSIGTVAPIIVGGPVVAAAKIPGAIAGATIAGAGQMGLMGAAEQGQRARASGANQQTAQEAAIWGAAGNALLGSIPFHMILKPIERASPAVKDWAIAKLKAMAESSAVFGGIGEAQYALGEKIAQELYDPKAGYTPDAERAMVSLITGAMLGGARRAPVREAEGERPVVPGETVEEARPLPQEPIQAVDRILADEPLVNQVQRQGAQLRALEQRSQPADTDTLFPERREPTPATDTLFPERVEKPPEVPPLQIPPVTPIRPSDIKIDPRYQYRAANERGITETPTAKEVEKFDPTKANPILAHETLDGNINVVNGFHRTELARQAQLGAGQSDIQIAARILREADGHSPEFMKQLGVYQNIAEGTGGREAAQILRSNPQGIAERLGAAPSTERVVQDAKALASLSPEAFGLVSKGTVPASYAAEIARLLQDQTSQVRALESASRAKPENIDQVRQIAREFQPLAAERQAVLNRAVEALEKSSAINQTERANNERLAQTLQSEASRQGQIAKVLDDAAKQLSAGRPLNAVAPNFLARARPIARRQLEGVQQRAVVDGAGPAGQDRYSIRPTDPRNVHLEPTGRTGDGLFIIKDGDRQIGDIAVSKKGKSELRVDGISALGEPVNRPNSLGPAVVRKVMQELKKEYPEAKTISGTRVTGARNRLNLDNEGLPEVRGRIEPKEKFSLTPAAQQKRVVLEHAIERFIQTAVGSHVRVKFSDTIPLKDAEGYGGAFAGVKTAAGRYIPAERVIELALADPRYGDPFRAAAHESFHVVQDLLATPIELKLLKRDDAKLRSIAARELGLTPDQSNAMSSAEVQAIGYETWVRNRWGDTKPVGPITHLYQRIQSLLKKVANALHGLGFKTSEDVFKTADSWRGMADRTAPEVGRFTREGQGETAFPSIATSVPTVKQTPRTDTLGPIAKKFSNLVDKMGLGDVARDIQIKLTPGAARDATIESRAAAKDFANGIREAKWTRGELDGWIEKNFTRDEQKRMWEAADAESVALQTGKPTTQGLSSLTTKERQAVERLQKRADDVFDEAKRLGIYEGDEKLPSYVTRLILMNKGGGKYERPNFNKIRSLDSIGGKLRTTTQQMIERKYLTVEETESAAKAKLGPEAEVLKNIRVLPYATGLLQEAIAGRKLIERIKEAGKEAGNRTVAEGEKPQGNWFTIDHPAFYNTRETADGTIQRTPIFVRSDFEGPLRSVLEQNNGSKIYQALMNLKGKTMSVIMMSPMIHNQVEWGRALPAMPGKVLTGRIYFEGNAAKNDPAIMREAIRAGLVPIGHRGYMQDITSVQEAPNLAPGRSTTSQIAAFIPNLFSKTAGDAVKRTVDKMGDFWHNTLLWDRIGDLQAGLYTNLRDHLVQKGFDPSTAQRAAAHWANRYAGAIPIEAMSANARKIANLVMFSRSFTLGNLGVMKDSYSGLPRDIQAQIARDVGFEELAKIKSVARRKATAVVMIDMGLFFVMNSLLQSAINTMGVGQTAATIGGALGGAFAGSLIGGPLGAVAGATAGGVGGYNAVAPSGDRSIDEEVQKYKDRFSGLLKKFNEHPFEVLNPFAISKNVEALSATAENEPGKSDRVLVGYQKDGTAIYMRLPPGKIGEEFLSYQTSPIDMMHRKLGTWARPLSEIWSNDKGFGRKIYDKNADTAVDDVKNVGRIAWHLLSSQVPVDWVQSLADLESGHGDKTTNLVKSVGPLLGATFSKGAPEGPQVGVMYRNEERNKFNFQMHRDDIKRMIEDGKIDEAVEKMSELNVPAGLQKYYLGIYGGGSRLKGRKVKDFMSRATPEEIESFNRGLSRQSAPPPVNSPFDLGATPVRP